MKTRSGQVMAALSAVALASVLLVPGSSAVSATVGAAAPGSPALRAAALSAACKGTPTAGGSLTLAVQNQTLSLDPYNTPGGFGDGEAQSLIYQGLVRLDPTGKTRSVVPAIANKWTISNGGKSYTFYIRKGLTYSNGQLVTGTDVKNALDTWANPKLDQYASSFSQGYKSTTVLNASQVRVNLSQPVNAFLYYLAMPAAEIYPAQLAISQGQAFWNHPIGSGPFVLQSWKKGSSITFAKNPTYWQSGHPLLNKVVFNFVTDDNTRLLDLKAGQAQVIDSVPFDQVSSLRAYKNLVVTPYKIPSWILLPINNKKAPFNNVKVRQALSYAIDRSAINKKVYSGLGTVPNSVLPQLQYDAPNSKVPADSYNLAKAQQLMKTAGLSKGFSATFEYPSGNSELASVALVLQQEWAQIGVKLTLRAEDQATLSKSFTSGTYDLEIPYALAVSDVVVPQEFASLYALPSSSHGFYSWWSDPSIASMVRQLDHSTANPATLWPKIQAAMQTQQPTLNVLDLPYLEGMKSNVCANYLTPIGYESLIDTWLAK
jgi:peptide/nickel transport system substrate-binding protein